MLRGPVSIPLLGSRPEEDPLQVVLTDKWRLSKESADAWTRASTFCRELPNRCDIASGC